MLSLTMIEEAEKGRGAHLNPANRFLKNALSREDVDGIDEVEEEIRRTKFIEVFPKTIVNEVKSPDVGMVQSLNPYQGCEHGCTYCYARPTHEYWGYSAGIDFERTILVKKNAPELLEKFLSRKSYKVRTISISGNTDCYQPCEKNFGITRELLKILLRYRHPVGIITKNTLIERDMDILEELAHMNLVSVSLSITSLDEELRRKLEPRTASVKKKLAAIENLTRVGIPVNIMMAPVIPALTDHEILPMIAETAKRGARSIGYTIVRLNGPNGEIFTNWLHHFYPDRAEKVLNQLKDLHAGKVSDSRFGARMRGEGNFALNVKRQFEIGRARFMAGRSSLVLRNDLFLRNDGQLSLFG